MNDNEQFLGIVQEGQFVQLLPAQEPGGVLQFTTISPQEARPPESGLLTLDDYDGNAVLISGSNHGGWIFNSIIVDCGGPIVTLLVHHLFDTQSDTDVR